MNTLSLRWFEIFFSGDMCSYINSQAHENCIHGVLDQHPLLFERYQSLGLTWDRFFCWNPVNLIYKIVSTTRLNSPLEYNVFPCFHEVHRNSIFHFGMALNLFTPSLWWHFQYAKLHVGYFVVQLVTWLLLSLVRDEWQGFARFPMSTFNNWFLN